MAGGNAVDDPSPERPIEPSWLPSVLGPRTDFAEIDRLEADLQRG
jgi:hypothetical protein